MHIISKIVNFVIRFFLMIIKFITLFPIFTIILFFSPRLFNILFQNKHYKLTEEINKDEQEKIKNKWQLFINQHNVQEEYKNDCLETLEYFSKFDKQVIFNAEKTNPQYMNINYIFHIISLAKEAIKHLYEVTADDKRIAYYESNNNSSLDALIELYMNKLDAKNEDKLSIAAARNEIKFRKFIIKLKKHDTLFINFYLMLATIYPISSLNIKEKDKDYIKLVEDVYEFIRIGHATEKQIQKSVAIQLYKLYENNISNIDLPTSTTKEELEKQISNLINFIFQTDKAYKNFNNIDQEAYVKNIIYNFPLFECDSYLAKRQIRRFKFYFIDKTTLVPRYIPKFFRRLVFNKLIKTPLSFYRTNVSTTLFGIFRKKI